jgi:hypothetical protein
VEERLFVDKTPSYAISLNALKRSDAWFDQPRYIHLARHPLACIRSWKSVNFDQVVHAPPRLVAEATWLICHENILKFLEDIPPERQMRLRFEDLVRNPDVHCHEICRFLGLEFRPELLDPYQGDRMLESIKGHFPGDKMFYKRTKIDPSAADSSCRKPGDGLMAADTIAVAQRLGYSLEEL